MFWSLASSWVVLPSSQRSMAASACSHALSSAALRAAALGLEACIRTSLACPTRQIEWLKAMRGCAHWKLLKGLPHGSASTALSEWSKPMRSASITSMPLPGSVCAALGLSSRTALSATGRSSSQLLKQSAARWLGGHSQADAGGGPAAAEPGGVLRAMAASTRLPC